MPDDILAIEDCVDHVSANFLKDYPREDGTRATIGNIPTALHAEITRRSEDSRVHAAVYVASLMDFLDQYEIDNKKQLTVQRHKPTKKRK